ncbi:MAG TPA: TrkA family potassium uptake protein, partial [Desulfuromonadales bacterium]|nr:TrkA family potassium uptake protein [Desulfuromonadales bacterium]
MKNFVVVGLGKFGEEVAAELTALGNQVLAIDADKRRVDDIKDRATTAVIADARDRRVLAEFISADIDAAVLNLGDSLEANALVTLNLVQMGVKRIIAKAENASFGQILQAIGATELVYPEREGAMLLARRLHTPNLIDHIPLAPEYDIVELAVPEDFVGKSMAELRIRSRYGVVVIAVKDMLSGAFHLIPEADYQFGPDSAMIIIG